MKCIDPCWKLGNVYPIYLIWHTNPQIDITSLAGQLYIFQGSQAAFTLISPCLKLNNIKFQQIKRNLVHTSIDDLKLQGINYSKNFIKNNLFFLYNIFLVKTSFKTLDLIQFSWLILFKLTKLLISVSSFFTSPPFHMHIWQGRIHTPAKFISFSIF